MKSVISDQNEKDHLQIELPAPGLKLPPRPPSTYLADKESGPPPDAPPTGTVSGKPKPDLLTEKLEACELMLHELRERQAKAEEAAKILYMDPKRAALCNKHNEQWDTLESLDKLISDSFKKKAFLAKDSDALERAKSKYDANTRYKLETLDRLVAHIAADWEDKICSKEEYEVLRSFCERFESARSDVRSSAKAIMDYDKAFLKGAGVDFTGPGGRAEFHDFGALRKHLQAQIKQEEHKLAEVKEAVKAAKDSSPMPHWSIRSE